MPTFGVIYGNRDFFPDHLVTDARKQMADIFARHNIEAIQLSENDSKLGGVETHAEAARCADLFRKHRDAIDGVLVILPNFGDERGVLDTLKLSKLDVPVLVQAYPDAPDKLKPGMRRDSWCGKISVCNNLQQRGIPYSLTGTHVIDPASDAFAQDLQKFIAVCRVVKKVRSARVGAVGARPGAFNTVRYSEKLLERTGIEVITCDLSEIQAECVKMNGSDKAVQAKIEQIRQYANAEAVPETPLESMAKLGVALDAFAAENSLDCMALQCWTNLQHNFGCNACTVMSMMSNNLFPNGCEVDVTGVLSMYAIQQASGRPAGLVDWNNNYGDAEDKCVLFHCGNWPNDLVGKNRVSTAPILGTTVGEENTWGALEGRASSGPMSYARISTDDASGSIKAYIGDGSFTDDPLDTFGNHAVVQIPGLNRLMTYICNNGFEHHVAIGSGHSASVLSEAFGTYLGWDVYHHAD